MNKTNNTTPNRPSERASVYIPKASVTVEAALALPVFFFAVIALVYLLEISAIQTSVKAGVHSAAKIAAKEMYLAPVINPVKLQSDIVRAVGSGRLDRSIVVDGSSGLHCYKSYVSSSTGEMQICVEYKVRLPFPQFTGATAQYREKFRMKAWTGYVKDGMDENNEVTVYITDTGNVYHKDYNCTYLKLSIQTVSLAAVPGMRNDSGGKYRCCERCGGGNMIGGVYITNDGDRYHSSLTCSGLKRTIYAVALSEVEGKGACSRCGQ